MGYWERFTDYIAAHSAKRTEEARCSYEHLVALRNKQITSAKESLRKLLPDSYSALLEQERLDSLEGQNAKLHSALGKLNTPKDRAALYREERKPTYWQEIFSARKSGKHSEREITAMDAIFAQLFD